MTQAERASHCIVDCADSGITTLTIANAGALNILGTPVIAHLARSLGECGGRAVVRVMVPAGGGVAGQGRPGGLGCVRRMGGVRAVR